MYSTNIYLFCVGSHLVFANLDCFSGVALTVEVDMINRILVFHSIIHVDNLNKSNAKQP
jgi:hypothetical protein